jgi:phosphoribosylanthranilate isomerase
MTKVKICGITSIADARFAETAGADAIGLNFYRGSPRYVDRDVASAIAATVSQQVFKVGVFVNERIEDILATAGAVGIDAVQLHGDETSEFANQLCDEAHGNLKIIKAFRITSDFDHASLSDYSMDSILIDAYASHAYGGTGEIVRWDLARGIADNFRGKSYLAGGLAPDNVADAIRLVRPYAVDACSRLETVPGRKDERKVADFITAAKGAI